MWQRASIIDNRDVEGVGRIVSTSPATGATLAEVSALDEDGARLAVEAARRAFPNWAATDLRQRQTILARFLRLLVEREAELAELVAREGGKPVAEARLVDIFPACETVAHLARRLHRMLEFQPVPPHQVLFSHWRAGYRFEPLGVVAIVTPWNYPVGIPVIEIASAVAAGNTVVFKPASATVLTGLAIGDLARRAGFPPGVVNTVALPGRATDALIDDTRVDKVLFTGSVEVGRRVAQRCAARLAPCQLELGGKDAAVVAADAHLERTARGLVWGAFMNTGQTCASIERVYAVEGVYGPLVERVVALTRELRVGDPLQPEIDLGPMTTAEQREVVDGHVRDALAGGATALTGGRMPEGPGLYYPPTVLVDVAESMRVIEEETFGPVLPIVPVKTLEEAVARANASRFGLTASGWTSSAATARRLERELRAGVVTINEHVVSFCEATASWGGVGESGIGRSHGWYGLLEMCNLKYVARDRGKAKAMPWYYPYDAGFSRFISAALPALYAVGWQRLRGLVRLATTRRFIDRVSKTSLLAGFDRML